MRRVTRALEGRQTQRRWRLAIAAAAADNLPILYVYNVYEKNARCPYRTAVEQMLDVMLWRHIIINRTALARACRRLAAGVYRGAQGVER